ncbi:MAG: response regulator transcription factor [Anaerolineales bacterium]|nr:response regulator transcription factor [Anaerolineales bacterium]
MIRILIVDDHAIVREGLRLLLEDEPGLEIVGDAADGEEALQKAQTLTPDVILLDLVLPDLNGIEVTRRVRAAQPECRILLLTSFAEDTNVVAAMQAGAAGYLLKDILRADLVTAIQKVARGEPALHPEAQRKLIQHVTQPPTTQPDPNTLTERERDILRLLAQGLSNKQIAGQLHITEGTVKGHVSNILAKLHLEDRTQAAVYAVKQGLA